VAVSPQTPTTPAAAVFVFVEPKSRELRDR
jgi:hypothetical protein